MVQFGLEPSIDAKEESPTYSKYVKRYGEKVLRYDGEGRYMYPKRSSWTPWTLMLRTFYVPRFVRLWTSTGREAIEKLFTGMFQQGHFSNHVNKDDQGQWSFTVQGKNADPIKLEGYWSAINVRDGDTWKIQMLTFNVTPPPAPAATK